MLYMIPFRKFKPIYVSYLFSSFIYLIIIPLIFSSIIWIVSNILANTEWLNKSIHVLEYVELFYSIFTVFPLISILSIVNNNYCNNYDFIIAIILTLAIIIYFYKLILHDTIFGKYSSIKIITNLKSINIGFLTKFAVLKFLNIIFCTLIFLNTYHVLKYYTEIIIIILYITTDFFIINWFFGKYLTIEELQQ